MSPFLWVPGVAYVTWSRLVQIEWGPICDHLFRSTGEIIQACNRYLGKEEILWHSHTLWVDSFLVHIGIRWFVLWKICPCLVICVMRCSREKLGWENHQISLSRHLQGHRALTPLPLWSASCVDHAWVELPGDWSRRVFGPEDRPVVGAGERSEGGQGPGQGLQTRNQRRILQ